MGGASHKSQKREGLATRDYNGDDTDIHVP